MCVLTRFLSYFIFCRFLTFVSALNSYSLQTLCLTLSSQNAAFNNSINESAGLIGLSICSHSLNSRDVESICELLRFGSTPNHSKYSGLKNIDLSDNKLSDLNCSELLRSAVTGPIEAIELAKNFIGKGVLFIEVSFH